MPASKKTRALFAYLLLSDRPRRRGQLCELFWDIPDDPRASLRWSLSKIRKLLEPHADWLEADRERVICAPPMANVDLLLLHHAASVEVSDVVLARLAESALDAPLAGLDLPNLHDYSIWLAGERARADRSRALVLRQAAALPRTDTSRARRYRETAEAIDPDGGTGTEAPAPFEPLDQTVHYCFTPDNVRIAYAVTGEGPPPLRLALGGGVQAAGSITASPAAPFTRNWRPGMISNPGSNSA